MSSKNPPLIVIVGETASGKSALAMEVARRFNGEIISADSWAIYKGMDIGSAKPSQEEQVEIAHHELDVVTPDGKFIKKPLAKDIDFDGYTQYGKPGDFADQGAKQVDSDSDFSKPDIANAMSSVENQNMDNLKVSGLAKSPGLSYTYTAAVFQANTRQHIKDISARGKLPIIAGGTGLYIDSILFNFSFSKTGDLKKRIEYNSMSIAELLELINQKGYDLTTIDTQNKRRLVRLLETEGHTPTRSKEMRPNTLVLGITRPRSELRKRIVKRTELMFKMGLRKEVQEVVDQYGLDCEGMAGISYQEFKDYYLNGLSMTAVKQKIIRNTLALAKRQRTWFKRHPQIVWVDSAEEGLVKVREFLD